MTDGFTQPIVIPAQAGIHASRAVSFALPGKKGTLKRGKDGHGGTVTSRKQAIAIGLSEAREKGAKVPSKRSATKRSSAKKTTAKKSTARKSSTKRATAEKSAS